MISQISHIPYSRHRLFLFGQRLSEYQAKGELTPKGIKPNVQIIL